MRRVKQASKQKRTTQAAAVKVLGAVGLSLLGSASASTMPTAGVPQTDNTSPNQRFVLGEEEMADVSLATFHLFDRENVGSGVQMAWGGCGGCRGCGGCGGFRGCGGGGFVGCRGCGGCGGFRGCGGGGFVGCRGCGGCGGFRGCGGGGSCGGCQGCQGCQGCAGCGGSWGACREECGC
jgi:hypothetical protein